MIGDQTTESELRRQLLECDAARQTCTNALAAIHMQRALQLAARVAGRDDGLREDLEDVALDALLDCGQQFDPSRLVAYWTYARHRILGRFQMYFRRQQRTTPAGLIGDDAADPMADATSMTEEAAEQWARRMLSEVGLLSEPAVDVLLGRTTRKSAAERLGCNYDMFCRRLARVKHTRAAQAFRERFM